MRGALIAALLCWLAGCGEAAGAAEAASDEGLPCQRTQCR